jgi:hypothetical protein
MNVWKHGCNWARNPNSFYDFIRDEELVIGDNRHIPFQRDDLVLISEGYTVRAIAKVLADPTPITQYPDYTYLNQRYGIDYVPKTMIARAEWYELPTPFLYEIERGAHRVKKESILNQAISAWDQRHGAEDMEIMEDIEIEVQPAVFEKLYREFVEFVELNDGKPFITFARSNYVIAEEGYKNEIYEQAKGELRVKGWTDGDIGTGEIHKRAAAAMSGITVDNNLIDWRKIDRFKKLRPNRELEQTLFDHFKNKTSNSISFGRLLKAGLDYQSIAYLFFVKDSSQFLPIAQQTFDFIISDKLQLDGFKTSGRAAWENYHTFIELVRQSRRFLRSKDPNTTLLDAHSFLWILGRQREEWLRSQDDDTERSANQTSLDTNNYLQLWLPEQIESDIRIGGNLVHAGSDQYERRKVGPGDTFWIVGVEDGNLILAGRIVVGELISYADAVSRFDDDVFEKKMHIVAHPNRAEPMRKISLMDIVSKIRFAETDRDRLEILDNRIDARQLQSLRKLDPESSRLIQSKWEQLDDQSALSERDNDIAETAIRESDLPELEKEQLVLARRGQGIFRRKLSRVEDSCRLTAISDKRFLIASHIKPWRLSTSEEKVDGNNGLWLSPHVDKLFDNGWITFTDDGKILCLSEEVSTLMTSWGLDPEMNIGPFNDKQRYYLRAHRELFNF